MNPEPSNPATETKCPAIHQDDDDAYTVPDPSLLPWRSDCPSCDSSGIQTKCPRCKGTGNGENSLSLPEPPSDCPDCDGSGIQTPLEQMKCPGDEPDAHYMVTKASDIHTDACCQGTGLRFPGLTTECKPGCLNSSLGHKHGRIPVPEAVAALLEAGRSQGWEIEVGTASCDMWAASIWLQGGCPRPTPEVYEEAFTPAAALRQALLAAVEVA